MDFSKHSIIKILSIILCTASLSISLFGQTINVTMQLNTSTNPDTLKENHFVQIRGALNNWQTGNILPEGKKISWDESSDLVMHNIGGDYWQITFKMNTGDTLLYKFATGFDDQTSTFNGWWEGPFNNPNGLTVDTRVFITGSADTTLPIQYYHSTQEVRNQYWRPFESKTDSVAIYFRLNMGGIMESEQFDPLQHGPVGVRGDLGTSGGVLKWGASNVVLTLDTASIDSSFWAGVAYIPKDSIQAGTTQKYKFFIENDPLYSWETFSGERVFTYPLGLKDTTLYWVYFDNLKPTGLKPVESTVTFRLNLEALEKIGLFDRSAGDKVVIRGAKGNWELNKAIEMNFQPALQEWIAQETFSLLPGSSVEYLYYIVWDSSRIDTLSQNYIPGLGLSDGWDEVGITGGINRRFVYKDVAQQSPEGDLGKEVQYFDSVPAEGVITTPIQVTFNIDMRPAADASTNPNYTLFRLGTDTAYIQFDGALFAVTQGLTKWGDGARVMLEDSDGDGIYQTTMDLNTPTWYMVSFVLAYTTETGEVVVNWQSGNQRGRRFYQYIHPNRVNTDGIIDWSSSYEFPLLEWKDGPMDVESPPDLFMPTSITENEPGIPEQFELEQNYPNPFNPVTKINYRLAKRTEVRLGIYNIKGQIIKLLVDMKQNPGKYSVIWNGKDGQGRPVASGIYLLKIKADAYSKVRKMMLVR
jgi:hypothetical protein